MLVERKNRFQFYRGMGIIIGDAIFLDTVATTPTHSNHFPTILTQTIIYHSIPIKDGKWEIGDIMRYR